ncbi:MAG: recombinase XerC, partial [Chloroflexi bacterium]|nr:recombinase XerC [Chloroflexota bacterium]
MLGHASIQTTTVYAKIVDRMAENPARYLEGLLGES